MKYQPDLQAAVDQRLAQRKADEERKCPSCGTPWVEHCGTIGLCADLQSHKATLILRCEELQEAVALLKAARTHHPRPRAEDTPYAKHFKAMNDFIAKHGGKK